MSFTSMKSRRPYVLPPLYKWMADSECTIHLLVDINYPDTEVPEGFDDHGQLVLDITPVAIRQLDFTAIGLTFLAQFHQKTHSLIVPYGAINAIVAIEPSIHISFEDDEDPPTGSGGKAKGTGHLKIVK